MEDSATIESIGDGGGTLNATVLSMIKSSFGTTFLAGEADSFDSLVQALAGGAEDSSNLGRATAFTQEEQELGTGKSKATAGETPAEAQVRDPTTWTIFQQDGPNHLGLW